MVILVFLTPVVGWMVTLVFLTPAVGWIVTLVFLTPAVGWMVTLVFLTPVVDYPNLTQIRMVKLDQVHWGRLNLGPNRPGSKSTWVQNQMDPGPNSNGPGYKIKWTWVQNQMDPGKKSNGPGSKIKWTQVQNSVHIFWGGGGFKKPLVGESQRLVVG